VIQVSALGADDAAASEFLCSKKAADDCLRELDLDWLVLRPSLVFGRGGGSAAMFAALSALPVTAMPADGGQWVQPLSIDDLTGAVVALLADHAPSRMVIDLVGPRPISFATMLSAYRNWLSLGPARPLHIPLGLMRVGAGINGRLGGLLAGPALNCGTLQMLERGNCGDAAALSRLLGRPPIDIGLGIATLARCCLGPASAAHSINS